MKTDIKQKIKDANTMLGMGTGLAAFGAGSAMLIGATCPLCIVAAPVLVGIGVVGRVQAARLQKTNDNRGPAQEEEGNDG